MFFLLRSAACITAVVLALPGVTPSRDAVLRSGTAAIRDLCEADGPRCAAVLQGGVATVVAAQGPSPVSRIRLSSDTLRQDDVRYGWAGASDARPSRRPQARANPGL